MLPARHLVVIALSSAAVLLASCDSGGGGTAEDAGEDTGGVAPADVASDAGGEEDVAPPGAELVGIGEWTAPSLAWEPCPSDTFDPASPSVECVTVAVPLRWDEPDGATIDLFLKRFPAKTPSDEPRTLWLLAGGPGQAGAVYDGVAAKLSGSVAGLTLIVPDHRGTGRSTRLGCPLSGEDPDSEDGVRLSRSEASSCLDELVETHGDALQHFTVTWAAADVGMLARELAAPSEPVFIYGASYGTYWAHRVMQLFPELPAGVILDGVLPPDRPWFDDSDRAYNDVGEEILGYCEEDTRCVTRLGTSDVYALALEVLASLDAGHCPTLGWDAAEGRALLAPLLPKYWERQLVPAVVFRLQRCETQDVIRLRRLREKLTKSIEKYLHDGWPLGRHIILSEMVTPSLRSWEVLEDEAAGLVFSTGSDALLAWLAQEADWPTYAPDDLAYRVAVPRVPVLILNGTLDPATPIRTSDSLAQAWKQYPHVQSVVVPYGGHCAVWGTPTSDGGDCGESLLLQFLAAPGTAVDASCADDVAPPDFIAGANRIAGPYLGYDTTAWGL